MVGLCRYKASCWIMFELCSRFVLITVLMNFSFASFWVVISYLIYIESFEFRKFYFFGGDMTWCVVCEPIRVRPWYAFTPWCIAERNVQLCQIVRFDWLR
jgi:hypothetical protein